MLFVFSQMHSMTSDAAYNYLLSFANLPRKEYMRSPEHCSVYLKRVQLFLNRVGNPEKKIPHIIHIAGTSGKGSVTANMHSILHAAGKRVASTYSPHPSFITERWKIGNTYMPKARFAALVEELKPHIDEYARTSPYDMLSFFELTEVIGLLWFAREKVEWLVLETACGGRFDSSNVVPHKDAAIITNIGLDHVDIIGNNKSEIAHEKIGIVRRGVPTFTTERSAQILRIFEKECQRKHAPLFVVDATPTDVALSDRGTTFFYEGTRYRLSAPGVHQVRNALLCLHVARYLGINEDAIRTGLAHADQPLRMEVISRKPLIILDGAHNPDKMRTTVEAALSMANGRRVHLLVGFSADKNMPAFLRQLTSLNPASIACTRNTLNAFRRVADPKAIAQVAKRLCPNATVELFLDPAAAYAWSKKRLNKADMLLATGSIFLSGELRSLDKAR